MREGPIPTNELLGYWLLTLCVGCMTTTGAIVLLDKCIQNEKNQKVVIVSSLGFAAAVMLYISL